MADFQEQFSTINVCLTDLNQITKIQVGYDTDGNFSDVFTEGSEYIDLTALRSTKAVYSATNTNITKINIIKIIGKEHIESPESVLAYRPTNYTLDVIPSDTSEITVSVSLFTTIIGEIEGSIELNYLEHSSVLNPETVHPNIYNLAFQESIGDVENKFINIIVNKEDNQFDYSSDKLQRKNNTPVYVAGQGYTYSNLLWYYWNVSKSNI